jgi:acetyl esterase/lipase
VFVHGDGVPEQLRDAKDWGQYRSWAELVAAEGLIGIAFNHRSTHDDGRLAEASNEVMQAVAFAVAHADDLRLDASRLCVWTCSAGAPLVLPTLLRAPPPFLRCLVCYYGLMDLEHLRSHAPVSDEILRTYSPVHQLRVTAASLPPILIARAGRDAASFNRTIDAFVAVAVTKQVTLDLLTHPEGDHAFDILNDTPRSKAILRRTLEFMADNLRSPS